MLIEKHLLRGLQCLDLGLQGLLLCILGAVLLAVCVAGLVEQLCGVRIVLERKLGQGLLLSRSRARLLFDTFGPSLHLLVGLRCGEAVSLGPAGDRSTEVRLLFLRRIRR